MLAASSQTKLVAWFVVFITGTAYGYPEERIYGGTRLGRGIFPSVAGYTITVNSTTQVRCAGTLIDSTHILTAAHCLHGYQDKIIGINVYLNTTYFTPSTADDSYVVIRNVSAYKIHESYNSTNLLNDIAILTLSQAIGQIDAGFLLNDNTAKIGDFEGDTVWAVGWGATQQNNTNYSYYLTKGILTVLAKKYCHQKLDILIYSSQICTLTTGVNICAGDDGGPLYITNGSQLGIVSFGNSDCGSSNKPGVYTFIPYYIDWIKKNSNVN